MHILLRHTGPPLSAHNLALRVRDHTRWIDVAIFGRVKSRIARLTNGPSGGFAEVETTGVAGRVAFKATQRTPPPVMLEHYSGDDVVSAVGKGHEDRLGRGLRDLHVRHQKRHGNCKGQDHRSPDQNQRPPCMNRAHPIGGRSPANSTGGRK